LSEELLKKLDPTAIKHSCRRSCRRYFQTVVQIGLRYNPVSVARTLYAELPAMQGHRREEPFEAVPKESHVGRKTHVDFIAGGIGQADSKVIKIRYPAGMPGAPGKNQDQGGTGSHFGWRRLS